MSKIVKIIETGKVVIPGTGKKSFDGDQITNTSNTTNAGQGQGNTSGQGQGQQSGSGKNQEK